MYLLIKANLLVTIIIIGGIHTYYYNNNIPTMRVWCLLAYHKFDRNPQGFLKQPAKSLWSYKIRFRI